MDLIDIRDDLGYRGHAAIVDFIFLIRSAFMDLSTVMDWAKSCLLTGGNSFDFDPSTDKSDLSEEWE